MDDNRNEAILKMETDTASKLNQKGINKTQYIIHPRQLCKNSGSCEPSFRKNQDIVQKSRL